MRGAVRVSLLLLSVALLSSPIFPGEERRPRRERRMEPAGRERKKEEVRPEEKKSEKPPGPLQAITGGWVLPVSGAPIPRGTILFRDGKIVDVGPELPLPENTVVHRADGKYVCPGFVAVEASRIGVSNLRGKIRDSLDPYQLDLKIALATGITTAHVMGGSSFSFMGRGRVMMMSSSGSSAVIKLTVGDLKGMFLKEPVVNNLSFRRSPLSLFQLRENFRKAAEHIQQVREAEKATSNEVAKKKAPRLPRELAQYVEILKNEHPTVVNTDSLEDIRTILSIRRQFPFDLILRGVEEGWKMAPELAAENVPVLVKARGPGFRFDFTSPAVPDDGMIPIRLPGAFARAGVEVALLPYSQGISLNGLAGRDLTALPQEGAFAVRGGMEQDAALRAITLEPARILRLADRVGSLEKGKDADILILNLHPLHTLSFVETAFINGKIYYERSKSPLYRDIPLR